MIPSIVVQAIHFVFRTFSDVEIFWALGLILQEPLWLSSQRLRISRSDGLASVQRYWPLTSNHLYLSIFCLSSILIHLFTRIPHALNSLHSLVIYFYLFIFSRCHSSGPILSFTSAIPFPPLHLSSILLTEMKRMSMRPIPQYWKRLVM